MSTSYDPKRTSRFFIAPALALILGGCPADEIAETDTDTGESSTGTSTGTDPSMPTTVDPTVDTTLDPTTTTVPTTTDTTLDPTTVGPTTDPDTTTTTTGTDTDTSTGTDTDTTGTGTDTSTGTDTETTGTTADTDTTTGGPVEFTGVWASANPAGLASDGLHSMNPALDAKNAVLALLGDAVSIQSVGINTNGDAIVTYDAPGAVGGVVIVKDMTDGNPPDGPIGLGTRVIRGAATGLIAPKGVEALGLPGLFIVADTGAADMKVFKITDDGDVAPQFAVTDLGTSTAVWDMHYVNGTDTLYAAGTNGEVQVYEEFSLNQGANGPDRTITPAENGQQISINLHGITVNANRLYLSDVGDPMDATDGQLFVIDDVDLAEGLEDVSERLQGGSLGNPVDLELRTGIQPSLFVAEKSNDLLLVYTPNLVTQELELNKSLAVVKPESVALTTSSRVVVASNPAGLETDTVLLLAAPVIGDLSVNATFDRLGSITSVQSVVLADNGAGWVSFDGPAVSGGGGVFIVDGLTAIGMDGEVSTRDARIWGPETGLVQPKALALDETQAYLFVADTGAVDIKVFSTAALGNVSPLFNLADLGGGAVWDMVYDDASGLLFAAGVDGTVRVFENVLVEMGGAGPARIFTPTDANNAKISINLHGIHYEAVTKTLILSDVGSPADPNDGQIFVIADADVADGDVPVQAQIGGDQTKLGNPVDIAFDGANLYVAEKSNASVLRFDGVLDLAGNNNIAASAMIEVPGAESVQLAYTAP